MNARAKMVWFRTEALLVLGQCLFEIFRFLMTHSHVVEGVWLWWALYRILCLDLDCFLKGLNGLWVLYHLVQDFSLQKVSISVIRIDFYHLI